ncbi:TatD family hydrolase, partial [bacterium]|nr:TatD family hydrolase [bacterium]
MNDKGYRMAPYIDAHCHLYDGAVCGAADAGGWIVNATNESEWGGLIAAASGTVFPAIGIHPWYADAAVPGWDTRLADLLQVQPELMVGEIGLDRARGDMAAQNHVFARQMDLAARFQRAVHVHVVRAWDVVLADLARRRELPPAIVLHGFRGNADIMRQLMHYHNIYFSFARADAPGVEMAPVTRI